MDYQSIFNKMILKLYKYMTSNNLKTMVLGISGGIDSTLCAAICSEVEKISNGEIKLVCVSMMSHTNELQEFDSAKATMDAFAKNPPFVFSINDEYEFLLKKFESVVPSTNISRGNIKARLRMMYLYNIASVMKGLVIDTDNLTEHYLGFFTLHGDQGDYNPIGMLWKHEIFEMVRYLKDEFYIDAEKAQIALQHALDIVPTDGNGVKAGGDLAQIAPSLTYEQVDEILRLLVEKPFIVTMSSYKTNPDIQKLYDKYGEDVYLVVERHKNSAFKRVKLPIVPSNVVERY